METMDFSKRLQEEARKNRVRLIAGVAVGGISLMVFNFLTVVHVDNRALGVFLNFFVASSLFAAFIFLALRLLKKMETDGFEGGMHMVMETVPIACSLYDKDNNIKYCNDKGPKLFGYRSREEYYKNYAASFPEFQPNGEPSDRIADKFIGDAIRDGSAVLEWYQKTSAGDLIPLELTSVRAFFHGEQHMLEFTQDLREEREIRRKEDELKKKMQAILDASPLLCGVYDENGNALDVNKEAENLFGISDKRIFVERFNDFLPPRQPDGSDSLKKIDEVFKQTIRDGRARCEWMYRRMDGTPLPTEEIMTLTEVGGKKLVIAYSRDLRGSHARRAAEQVAQKRLHEMTDRLNGQLETQASAITESSAAIEEMVANIRSVSNTLSKNAANVRDLQEASEVGHSGLSEVAADIREIARESESLLEINSVMQNIASQTNLLSMNAAIEAAHAGESGRGFAVVADEIRKLAESSSQQSKTISSVLKKIKGSIDKITRSTDSVMAKFSAIDGGVRVVAEQEDGILNAMTEQGAGSAQIMQAIAQVNEITGQVKDDARQMVEAAAKLGV